jgi:4'-phosphopantetheinyl transferase
MERASQGGAESGGTESAAVARAVGAVPSTVPDAEALLDPTERARWERLHDARDRQAFAAAHGLLKIELARLHGGAPEAWEIGGGGAGPPVVVSGPLDFERPQDLTCSLAHARGLVAVAIATCPIGVDCERLPTDWDIADVCERIASPLELENWRARGSQPIELLRLWCGKEAVSKGLGAGLALDPRSIQIEVDPANRGELRHARALVRTDAGPNEWALLATDAPDGGVVVLAVPASAQVRPELLLLAAPR